MSIDVKANEYFPGKVVRKDLTGRIKGNASVPTYVLEYLLGQYCATDDEHTIEDGVEKVKNIISKHFVSRDEAQAIMSTVREKGTHRIIDKLSVRLNDKKDRYEANFSNLGLNRIPIADHFVKSYKKLLSEGVWCILTLGYETVEDKDVLPWTIDQLKPIQISGIDVDEYKEVRSNFTKDEWIDLLMQSIGLNPEEFSFRSKLIQLSRLVPFAENNYNLIELGPKGTGKSHIYSELSPHGILISGGEVSKAKLFVNNSSGDIGLVGYWDVVAYDEFAGKAKKTDKGLVDIMKNYMANKSFSRGTNVYQASASMVFVGNTDRSVQYMLKHSDLFESLPKDYYDTAFLDRIHSYIPGWEVKKLRNEMFTGNFGFIVDYIAEIMKFLRKEDHTKSYQQYFELSNTITTRDKNAIEKTFSGLAKVIYPHGVFSEDEARELLSFAVESRKRVKDQLRKMDETFDDEIVHFSFTDTTGKEYKIECLEILQHMKPQPEHEPEEGGADEAIEKEPRPAPRKLEGKHSSFMDNQSGVTFKNMFGDYLKGATEITVVDPYIRLPYQLRNFKEFCSLIVETREVGVETSIHLVTNNNEDYIMNAKESFQMIQDSLSAADVQFSYEFSETAHDRSIVLNNGWKIILGRGLDIWQKTAGRDDIAEMNQAMRLCKEFEMTIIAKRD